MLPGTHPEPGHTLEALCNPSAITRLFPFQMKQLRQGQDCLPGTHGVQESDLRPQVEGASSRELLGQIRPVVVTRAGFRVSGPNRATPSSGGTHVHRLGVLYATGLGLWGHFEGPSVT